MHKGNFTLPGEAGQEALTLELAERWGADVIRDSDGTTLSGEILDAGYDIYSTLCIIRDHNVWIREHLDARQQCFLCTAPTVATEQALAINPMADFFDGQFAVNASADAMPFWQVYDRTCGEEVPTDQWRYDADSGLVHIQSTPWHRYTVSFLAWRIWEEISMYNHVTNAWDKERLMQLDPYHPGARAYLRTWLERWCEQHPQTNVVRFTALYYNFVWIWGTDARNRNLFTDWASYDFTVCPAALRDFEAAYGYALCAEDFVRAGKYNATHCVPSTRKWDWMAFIGGFVRTVGKEHVDIVHAAGKKAYVFYDDSWVGMEPYSGQFEMMGFDGIIKCVFSGYEARLCAGVPAKVHELRFHPYLFPVGLGGAPTFSPGGKPGRDALEYWVNIRRALLRQKVERAGLGGYLHLVKDYPDFVAAMDDILAQFRQIAALHDQGAPLTARPRIAIVHAWGALRTWTLSGHFHETHQHVLIHVLESLAGLPFDVRFLSFDDLRAGVPEDVDILINAGEAGSAWSGGAYWQDVQLVETLTAWVHGGGVFMGIGAPSAADGGDTLLRMAHVLGVDIDRGDRCCHGRWPVEVKAVDGLEGCSLNLPAQPGLYLTDGKARVLMARDGQALVTRNDFGQGCGVYLTGFEKGAEATRWLHQLLNYAATGQAHGDGMTCTHNTECAIYPKAGKLALINNGSQAVQAACDYLGRRYEAALAPYGMAVLDVEA